MSTSTTEIGKKSDRKPIRGARPPRRLLTGVLRRLFRTVPECCPFLAEFQFCLITNHIVLRPEGFSTWSVIKQNWNSVNKTSEASSIRAPCGTGDEELRLTNGNLLYMYHVIQYLGGKLHGKGISSETWVCAKSLAFRQNESNVPICWFRKDFGVSCFLTT